MKLVFISDSNTDTDSNSSISSSYGSGNLGSTSTLHTPSYSPSLAGRITGTGNFTPSTEPTNENVILKTLKSSSAKLLSAVRREQNEEFDPSKHWSTDFQLSNFGMPPTQKDYTNSSSYSMGERTTQKGTPGGFWSSHDDQSYTPPSMDDLNEQQENIEDSVDSNSNSNSEANETNDFSSSRASPSPKPSRNVKKQRKQLKENQTQSNTPVSKQTTQRIENDEGEQLLVDKTTAPGGIRSILSRMEVGQFIRKAKEMNMQLICDLLYEKAFDPSNLVWQSKLRALCLLEGLIEFKNLPNLQHQPETLVSLLDSPQKSIVERVRKIFQLLDYQLEESEEEIDYMNQYAFMDDNEKKEQPQSPLNNNNNNNSNNLNNSASKLFSGLKFAANAPTQEEDATMDSNTQTNSQNQNNEKHTGKPDSPTGNGNSHQNSNSSVNTNSQNSNQPNSSSQSILDLLSFDFTINNAEEEDLPPNHNGIEVPPPPQAEDNGSWNFIAQTVSQEGQRAQQAAVVHQQEILQKYKPAS